MGYSTAISHGVLTGAGIYGLTRYDYSTLRLPVIAYGIVVTHNTIGLIIHVLEDNNELERLYNVTKVLQTLFVFPCIVGELWLKTSHPKEIAYLHPGLSTIPLIMYFGDRYNYDLVTGLLTLNTISCVYVTVINENWMGPATALLFALAHGLLHIEIDVFDMPREDIYNYIFTTFVVGSFYALRVLVV